MDLGITNGSVALRELTAQCVCGGMQNAGRSHWGPWWGSRQGGKGAPAVRRALSQNSRRKLEELGSK